jgi:hypothetical protein
MENILLLAFCIKLYFLIFTVFVDGVKDLLNGTVVLGFRQNGFELSHRDTGIVVLIVHRHLPGLWEQHLLSDLTRGIRLIPRSLCKKKSTDINVVNGR